MIKLIDYEKMRDLFNEKFLQTRQLILSGETHLDNLAEGFHEADGVIWEMPTIEVPRWIPVTERLPDNGGYYLVHHKSGLVSQRLFYDGQNELFWKLKYDPVTHWMPLPDAPKE